MSKCDKDFSFMYNWFSLVDILRMHSDFWYYVELQMAGTGLLQTKHRRGIKISWSIAKNTMYKQQYNVKSNIMFIAIYRYVDSNYEGLTNVFLLVYIYLHSGVTFSWVSWYFLDCSATIIASDMRFINYWNYIDVYGNNLFVWTSNSCCNYFHVIYCNCLLLFV